MTVKVTKVPPKPEPATYILELDEYTAKVLFILSGSVSGRGPARTAMSDLYCALDDAGEFYNSGDFPSTARTTSFLGEE